eukprot:CAMPEP_0206191388 /NCGR_PEP_ID=MMETSP0166-20121206/5338_1 /ASSEMBLY_ACC=CAM_ASM_000260 /TAXON_ID=95228 /ORGANISM="Vannella robusta, Strain DIVA3 518/3/11/1/6" /LENGTH=33 /DNA_ID= /DNA_START= /DNA_END= /DNA_ORIENTATION=
MDFVAGLLRDYFFNALLHIVGLLSSFAHHTNDN